MHGHVCVGMWGYVSHNMHVYICLCAYVVYAFIYVCVRAYLGIHICVRLYVYVRRTLYAYSVRVCVRRTLCARI